MDKKKQIKDFINYICDWIEYRHRLNGDDSFIYEIPDDVTYLISDKAIDKRIEKQLNRRLNIGSNVEYKLTFTEYQFPRGKINIMLVKNSWCDENIVRNH